MIKFYYDDLEDGDDDHIVRKALNLLYGTPIEHDTPIEQQKQRKKVLDKSDVMSLQHVASRFCRLIADIINPMPTYNSHNNTETVARFVKMNDKLKFIRKVNNMLLTSSKIVGRALEIIHNIDGGKLGDQNKNPNIHDFEICVQLMEFNAEFVERSGIGCLFKHHTAELSLSRLNELEDKVIIINKRIVDRIIVKIKAMERTNIRHIFKREIIGKKNIIKRY